MLNVVIIACDQPLAGYLREVCAEFPNICIYKTLDFATSHYELARTFNSYSPDIVFLVGSDPDSWHSASVLSRLRDPLLLHPQTAVIPILARAASGAVVKSLPDLDLAPALVPPFSAEQFEKAILAAMQRKCSAGHRSTVAAFFPAKAGAGATTITLNLAHYLTRVLGSSTLLIEADLRSGSLRPMLNLPEPMNGDTIEDPDVLTESRWSRAVCRTHGFDILPASAISKSHPSRWDLYRLLKFAREHYEIVLVDLPDVVDEVVEAVVTEADKAYAVCTPETPSLRMVGRRNWELQSAGVRLTHLRVLVNRRMRDDPPPDQLSRQVKPHIVAVLAEDSFAVRAAVRRQSLLSLDSELARGLLAVAEDVAGVAVPPPAFPLGASLRKLLNFAFGVR